MNYHSLPWPNYLVQSSCLVQSSLATEGLHFKKAKLKSSISISGTFNCPDKSKKFFSSPYGSEGEQGVYF